MTRFVTLSREGFISWMATGTFLDPLPLRRPSDVPRLTAHEVALVWEQDGDSNSQPTTLLVERNEIREFFAFVSTYVSTHIPFTAFYRVITRDQLPLFIQNPAEPYDKALPDELISVAVAEALAQVGVRQRDTISISNIACRAALSFSLFSAMRQGLDEDDILNIAEKWRLSRRIFTDEKLNIPTNSIEDFWIILSSAYSRRLTRSLRGAKFAEAIDFISDIIFGSGINIRSWDSFTRALPSTNEALRSFGGNREAQVRILDAATREIMSNPNIDQHKREILIALLTAMVAQGSSKYFQMALGGHPNLSTVGLWFAFFCAIQPGNDMLTFSNGIGRHLLREMSRRPTIGSVPTTDISFEELQVYGVDERRGELNFRTKQPSSIDVELAPGIVGVFPLRAQRREEGTRQLNGARLRELRSIINHARALLDDISSPAENSSPEEPKNTVSSGAKYSRKKTT